ncbi:hypothetical protein [Phenylobacterium zucineum]|uniref:hypothetical protein n=1 Tax=Phenylobacterium zucineum TaxID=284016 RepID=UPI0002DA3666|nr:hypothetical protein [Phenylobacterium zucineum]
MPSADHLAAAVGEFARRLAREDLLAATARLQATVQGSASIEPLLRLEAALTESWPQDRPLPTHEIVWGLPAARPDGPPAVVVAAYDADGRLLLQLERETRHV